MFGFAYSRAGTEFLFFVLDGRSNEGGEERVRLQRLGFDFWMELTAEEPGMIGRLDDFDGIFIPRAAGDAQSRGDQRFLGCAVEFVAVAVAPPVFPFAVRLLLY